MNIKLPTTPWCPKGFTIESNEPMKSFDPKKLSLHLEPEQEKGYLNNGTIIERMKGRGLNSTVLKFLLDNPKYIPTEWKEKYVLFDGTITLGPDGGRVSFCLCWDGDEWGWHCLWFGDDRGDVSPSAVLEQVSSKMSDSKKSSETLSLALGYLDAAEESITKAKRLLK